MKLLVLILCWLPVWAFAILGPDKCVGNPAESNANEVVRTITEAWREDICVGTWQGLIVSGFLDPSVNEGGTRTELENCQIHIVNCFTNDILLQDRGASTVSDRIALLPLGGTFGSPRRGAAFEGLKYTRLKARAGDVVNIFKERKAGCIGGSMERWVQPLQTTWEWIQNARKNTQRVESIRITYTLRMNLVVVGSGTEYSPIVVLTFEDRLGE